MIRAEQSAFSPQEQTLQNEFLPPLTGESASQYPTPPCFPFSFGRPWNRWSSDHKCAWASNTKQQCEGAFIAASRAKNAHVLSARRGRRSWALYSLMGTICSGRLDLLQEKGTYRGLLSFRWTTMICFSETHWRYSITATPMLHLPDRWARGGAFSVDDARTCKIGGFPVYKHNEIRHIMHSQFHWIDLQLQTASLMEPLYRPLDIVCLNLKHFRPR